MWSRRPYTFDRFVRILFTVVVCCIALYLVYVLRHVLLPFCVACLVAYIIEPWVRWNRSLLKIKSHVWSVVLTTIEAAVIFFIISYIVIHFAEKEFAQLAMILKHYAKDGQSALDGFETSIHNFIVSHFDINKVTTNVEKINISDATEEIWKILSSGLDKLLGVLGWLISIIYVIFILIDFDKYKNGLKKYIPNRYKEPVSMIMRDVSWTMKKYFRNQALISVIVGICYAIGFWLVGIPMAVVIGLTNIILFMIPYMVYLSLIPVTIMCIFKAMEPGVDFWSVWFECLAVYAFVEIFSDIYLTPKVMGKALGLNPAVILLSLSIWGTLLGVLGMVIALPATTIISKWLNIWLSDWRDRVNNKNTSIEPQISSGEEAKRQKEQV